MNDVTRILTENKEQAIDDLVATLIGVVPRYALSDPLEIRRNVESLFSLFLEVIEHGESTRLTATLQDISARRVQQGFAPADFIRALLMVYPVVRQVVRRAGPREDVLFARMFASVESAIFQIISVTTNIYAAELKRAAEQKAGSLQREVEGLKEHERLLEQLARDQQRSLQAAQELNSRVIASLSSGVMVVEHVSLKIVLWSARMEEITGIPADEALGRSVLDVAPRLKGMPAPELLATIRAMDRLPLTKVRLTTPQGVERHIFMRADRLHSEGNQVSGAVVVLDDITERELLIDSFSRYVSKEVVQRLLSRSTRTHKLDGERRNCSILFADIRGFTGISERVSLEHLHELLNQYFRVMIDLVAAHDGIIDKFIGDKIMAVFTGGGGGDGALAATRAAMAIQKEIEVLNQARIAAKLEPIGIGIGINTGEVVMGTVGSEERMSFTVIGDAVNVADRLQSLAGGGDVLIGLRTRELLGDKVKVSELEARQLKGRNAMERLFKLEG